MQPLEIDTGPEPRLSFLQREHWSPASFGQDEDRALGYASEADQKERRQRVKRICLSIQPCLGLQRDSVLNQIQHVSSLWESFHSREPTGDASQSIAKLRNTLLRMEQRWEAGVWRPFLEHALQVHAGAHHGNGNANGAADGPSWPLRSSAKQSAHPSTQEADDVPLRDVCLYLLLWGELGNLRFCPELLCFLFAAARAHLEWDPTGVAVLRQGAAKVSDGTFLENIVKPIYVAMASETFDLQKNGPPKPKGKGGPAQSAAANYDDWNELFWDPDRLADNLVVDIPGAHARSRAEGTGSSLLLEPASQKISQVGITDPREVWEMLHYVNWTASLTGKKSHFEVHTLLPLLVGNARIFMAQAWVFAALLVMTSQDPPYGTWLRRAAVGLVAPGFRWFHVLGLHYLTPGIPVWTRLRDVARLLFIDSLPVYTFLLIFVEEMQMQDTAETLLPPLGWPVTCNHPCWLLVLHAGLTLYSLAAGVAARPQNIYRWNFYPMDRQKDTWASVLFWICVAASKVALDYKVGVQVDLTIRRIWKPQWSELGHPLPDCMLVIRLLSMAVPAGLAALATTSLFVTFWVGLTGALRGIQIFGGLQLLFTRAGFAMMLIPSRTADRVLQVSDSPQPTTRLAALDWWTKLNEREMKAFVEVWNTMLRELYAADILTDEELKAHSFESAALARKGPQYIPDLFNQQFRSLMNNKRLPRNLEARRRIISFARAAQLGVLPREKVRTMPSFSVLIPHYSETIMMQREALFVKGASSDLLRFLIQYYSDEFQNFIERLRNTEPAAERSNETPGGFTPGSLECFSSLSEQGRSAKLKQVEMALCRWASQRLQTLWRTVEGISHAYEAALTMALKHQEPDCPPDKCSQTIKQRFQVVVAMQQYSKFTNPLNPGFDLQQAAAAEALLRTFGSCLCIAYIEEEPSSEGTRYYSCLIDDSCPPIDEKMAVQQSYARAPKFRVQLPGFPILGNGKSDNQNCAIIYTRGEILQMIDANQDAYFEAGLFLPLALKEFTMPQKDKKDGLRPGILGFREHIFSDIGLLGEWAASSEFAFGTIIQRTMDWPLNARLHYGHPDMLDKLQMVQQGGVSKATRGLNLSEDVFAGLDLTLRGGWSVYREYFHVGKGRDMGFMSVLGFHAKVSMGNGEQSISRQWLRAAVGLPFMRYASIYFLHVGWYFNQCLINRALHATAFLKAIIAMSTAHHFGDSRLRDAISDLIGSYFGLVYLCYVGASMVPLTLEIAVEHGPIAAIRSFLSSILSLNPIFAAFQSKLIDYHFLNTARFGGAKYIPTGRGLATVREPFLKLFRSFAMSHVYDALEIAFFSLLGDVAMRRRRGFEVCVWFTVTSWLIAPYLFNPFQFEMRASGIPADIRSWAQWLRSGSEREEEAWWAWAAANLQERRRRERGWEAMLPSIGFLVACSTGVVVISVIESDRRFEWGDLPIILPPFLHWIPCILVACIYSTDHGKDVFLYLAVVAALTAVPVFFYAWQRMGMAFGHLEKEVHEGLGLARLPAVLFHQFMALRWLLDSADVLLARQFTTRPLRFMQRTLRFWSLSWRLLRDAAVGTFLLALCAVLSILPNYLHTIYLFRVRLLQPEGAQQETANPSEPDELLVRFFSHFAPMKAASLAKLFQESVETPARKAEDSEPARRSLWHTMVRRFSTASGRETMAKSRQSRGSSSSSSPLSPSRSLEDAQDSLLHNSIQPSAAPEGGMGL